MCGALSPFFPWIKIVLKFAFLYALQEGGVKPWMRKESNNSIGFWSERRKRRTRKLSQLSDGLSIRWKGDKIMEPTKVRVWKAPAEAEARYVTVTSDGQLIDAWGTLAEIRKRYKPQIELGHVELVRELDKVYVPKNTSYKK